MQIDCVEKLCKFLISGAFQRCRMLDDDCRLSVSLTPAPPLVRISVSDTGVGSNLEEIKILKFSNNPVLTSKWDGVLCIVTTSVFDKELHLLKFDWKEVDSSRRLVRLPSITKNGVNFSGTEVSFSLFEEIDSIVKMISEFIQKMLILRTPRIAVELSVLSGGNVDSLSKRIVLESASSDTPTHTENIECLKLGLEDYVSKHRNRLPESCHSDISTEKILKVGSGTARRKGTQGTVNVMEVVIIISEAPIPDQSSCLRPCDTKTEVLCFRDFLPCPVSPSCLDALSKFDWLNYGMVLKSIADQDGTTILEWENLPPGTHIDMLLHRYTLQSIMQPLPKRKTKDKLFTTLAIRYALNELKEKHAGVLLSQHAAKICSYAPDLAKTISGLVQSSHDKEFQKECYTLLDLQFDENGRDALESCIKDKIIAVVTRNDKHPKGSTSRDAPLLFADRSPHVPHGPEDEALQALGSCDSSFMRLVH